MRINGGTFTPINGGTKAVYSQNFKGFIVGGTFNDAIQSAEYWAVAKVGDKFYGDLQKAVDAANDGDEIKLLRDITPDKVIEIKKSITIDGDWYTLDSNATRWIWIEAPDVNVFIKNLTVKSTNKNMERAIQVNDYKNITLNLDNCDLSASYQWSFKYDYEYL